MKLTCWKPTSNWNPSYFRSVCFGLFVGFFFAWFQATFPCQVEFQLNPFAGWQADDWYVSELEYSKFDNGAMGALRMQLVVIRFLRIMLDFGAVYILLPVTISCLVCYLEKQERKTVNWAILKSLATTTICVFVVCIIVASLSLTTETGQYTFRDGGLLGVFLKQFDCFLNEGMPWEFILIWCFIYTRLIYGKGNGGFVIRPKLVVTRILFVAVLWVVYGWNTHCPEWFPINPGHGCLKAPGANGVDDLRRRWEIWVYGEKPIWYPEIVFPKYPGGDVRWTRRMTFGRFKGWCEAVVQSRDDEAQMASFYEDWAATNGFAVQSSITYDHHPVFEAIKPELCIRYHAYRMDDGINSARIQQIPR